MNIRKKTGLFAYWICPVSLFISCGDANEASGLYDTTKRGNYSLAFQIKTGQAFDATRATDLFDGTKGEKAVSSVYILLYDAAGANSQLLYNIPIKAQTNGEENFHGQDVASGDPNKFISNPIGLKKQDYQLIVLVNPSTRILAEKARSQEDYGAECNTLKEMMDAFRATSANEFYNSNGETNFFMTNAGGVIYISQSQLEEKEQNALLNPVSVPIERILAKISLHNGMTSNQATLGGKIGAITWGIDVANRYTYLVRQSNYLISGAQETGFHPNREEVYAKDPNFNTNAQFISDEAKRKEQFTILSLQDQQAFINCNTSKTDNSYYQYVLENTISRADQNSDNTDPKLYTTQLLVKVIITEPKGMKDVTSYYSFYDSTEQDTGKKWKIFTHEQAVEWYNSTFPSDMVALKEILEQAQDMENSPFNFKDGEDIEPATYVATPFRLTYHKDGLNIYRIPIEHFGTNDKTKDVEDYGYYGVVRNNVYQIIIN
ncbi:MAG: Mfa1 family fimbria major subunit, partial [Bacteroides sp.]|nr:Mfa1 family fimbria major subunit [Bacteroides sp.]